MAGTSTGQTPIQGGRADYARAFVSVGGKRRKAVPRTQGGQHRHRRQRPSVKAADIARNGRYSVTALRETDIPALDYGMTNVTAKGAVTAFCPRQPLRGQGCDGEDKVTARESRAVLEERHQYLLLRQEYQALGGWKVRVDKNSLRGIKTTHLPI